MRKPRSRIIIAIRNRYFFQKLHNAKNILESTSTNMHKHQNAADSNKFENQLIEHWKFGFDGKFDSNWHRTRSDEIFAQIRVNIYAKFEHVTLDKIRVRGSEQHKSTNSRRRTKNHWLDYGYGYGSFGGIESTRIVAYSAFAGCTPCGCGVAVRPNVRYLSNFQLLNSRKF